MSDYTCRQCGEPVAVDGDGHVEHRDGLGSHPADPVAGISTPPGGQS